MNLTFEKIACAIAAAIRSGGGKQTRMDAYLAALSGRGMRAVERGMLPDAEACCTYVLKKNPAHGEALECLGMIAARRADWNQAIQYLELAIHARPEHARLHRQLAEGRRTLGDLVGAKQSLREALRLAPDDQHVLAQLAEWHFVRREVGNALAYASRALELEPAQPLAMRIYGKVLLQRGDLHGALTYLRRAAESAERDPTAWADVGVVLRALSRLDEARECYERALVLDPDSAQLHVALGDVYLATRHVDEAMSYYKEALRIAPDMPKALSRAALAAARAGDPREAERMLLRARDLAPGEIEPLLSLGHLYQNEWGRLADALDCYRRAKALDPIRAEVHVYSGLAHLSSGRLDQGWEELEWRLKLPSFEFLKQVKKPLWAGQDLSGRTILVQREPGGGTRGNIQFVRYAPLLADQGARVVLETSLEMKRLVARMRGVDRVVSTHDELAAASGDVDWRCPMLSLPHRFGTTLESMPAAVPYLLSDPVGSAAWQARIDQLPAGCKVGLSWSAVSESGAEVREGQRNSIPLGDLKPLASVAEVVFLSLQTDRPAADDRDAGPRLVDWTPDVSDLADLADLIATLDLIISVDTAVAHLAGAMGKPVWILLSDVADWRWMRGTDSSPWYPTARLFRQPAPGNWTEVVGSVAEALAELPRLRRG